jgi:hypothetical protein
VAAGSVHRADLRYVVVAARANLHPADPHIDLVQPYRAKERAIPNTTNITTNKGQKSLGLPLHLVARVLRVGDYAILRRRKT